VDGPIGFAVHGDLLDSFRGGERPHFDRESAGVSGVPRKPAEEVLIIGATLDAANELARGIV
jgi:hypothetical protein